MTHLMTNLANGSKMWLLAVVFACGVSTAESQAQSTRDLYGGGHRWQYDRSARSVDHGRYDNYGPRRTDRVAYVDERNDRAAERPAFARNPQRERADVVARAAYHPVAHRPLPPTRNAAYRAAVAALADTPPCYDASHRTAFDANPYPPANPYAPRYDYAPTAVNVNVAPQRDPRAVEEGRYVGRGIVGQPTLYAEGQPLRNFLRAFAL